MNGLEPQVPEAVAARTGAWCFDTMTVVTGGTWAAARGAIDAALTAADLVLGGAPAAYACCRPPGHHVTRSAYGGSCYLNNAAVAAQHLRDSRFARVALLDVDAHHGNGAQSIFWGREDVFTGSVHIDPADGWFPHFLGFADESGPGNLNVTVPEGAGDEEWLAGVDLLVEAVRASASEALVLALGVDAAGDDPNSPLAVTENGFREAGRRVGAAPPADGRRAGGWLRARHGRAARARGARRARGRTAALTRSPFWTLVWIRVAFLLGTAATLLWAPAAPDALPEWRAWDPVTDLVFGTFAQWDADWFLRIANEGYDEVTAAFFPLYPALVALLGSSLVLGTLLSLVAAGLGAWCVAEIARDRLGDDVARDTVLVLALFPTAFVFTAVYSEGLFLLLSAGSFLAAQRGRPWLAGIAGGLAVATRSMGLALLPALVYLLWPRTRREIWRLAPLALLPVALGVYALYLDREIGDAFAFTDAQATGWERELATLGPLGGLWMAIQAGGHGALEILRDLPRAGIRDLAAAPGVVVERGAPRLPGAARLAHVGRVEAPRAGAGPVRGDDPRRHPQRPVGGVSAREPAALRSHRLPGAHRARLGDPGATAAEDGCPDRSRSAQRRRRYRLLTRRVGGMTQLRPVVLYDAT